MKHRLTVKIEKRFKRQLSKRFNPRNARIINTEYFGTQKGINITCLLCDEFKITKDRFTDCTKCPFAKFGKGGCFDWLDRVVGLEMSQIIHVCTNSIYWKNNDDKRAIKLLKKLQKEAKKYIVWVEDTR